MDCKALLTWSRSECLGLLQAKTVAYPLLIILRLQTPFSRTILQSLMPVWCSLPNRSSPSYSTCFHMSALVSAGSPHLSAR